MNLEVFNDAIKAAKRSTIKTHQTGAAIYDSKGHLIAIGWSHVPSDRLVQTPWSKHAEHHALQRCNGQLDKAHTIIVATLRRNGSITLAKPCNVCASLIRKHNLKRVIWTESLM